MKKIAKTVMCLLAFFIPFVSACTDSNEVAPIVIEVKGLTQEMTLAEYMTANGIDYKISSGMITKIDGVSNTTDTYWMCYTSDTEKANKSWGAYDHNGQMLGSATEGANLLSVKEGCVYVWVYQEF